MEERMEVKESVVEGDLWSVFKDGDLVGGIRKYGSFGFLEPVRYTPFVQEYDIKEAFRRAFPRKTFLIR